MEISLKCRKIVWLIMDADMNYLRLCNAYECEDEDFWYCFDVMDIPLKCLNCFLVNYG